MSRSLSTQPFEVELIVEGQLDSRRSGWFEGMTLTSQPEDGAQERRTRITGLVADQAALFAIISRIRDLGLKLISVNRIENNK